MREAWACLEALEGRRLLSASLSAGHLARAATASEVVAAATPQPSEDGRSLTVYAKQNLTVNLGEFKFKSIDLALEPRIDWGDGSHSTGRLVGAYNNGEYYVYGTHTYSHTGTFLVNVKIFTHLVGGPVLTSHPVAEFTSVIKAIELKPSEGGRTLTETAGKKFTARLGEVTVKVVDLVLDAVISWGDGTKSAGRMIGSYATGEYYIEGTHTYAHSGLYNVEVKVFGHPIGSPIHGTSPLAQFRSVMKVKPS